MQACLPAKLFIGLLSRRPLARLDGGKTLGRQAGELHRNYAPFNFETRLFRD